MKKHDIYIISTSSLVIYAHDITPGKIEAGLMSVFIDIFFYMFIFLLFICSDSLSRLSGLIRIFWNFVP